MYKDVCVLKIACVYCLHTFWHNFWPRLDNKLKLEASLLPKTEQKQEALKERGAAEEGQGGPGARTRACFKMATSTTLGANGWHIHKALRKNFFHRHAPTDSDYFHFPPLPL